MESDKNEKLISKYFRGALSSSEEIAFYEALKDEAFRNHVSWQSDILEGLVVTRRHSVSESLKEARLALSRNSKVKSTDVSPRKSNIKKLIVLVLVSVILGTIFYLVKVKSDSLGQKIYASYYLPYETSAIARGGDKVLYNVNDDALNYYANHQYEEALELLLLVQPSSDDIKLLIANCYMNKNEYSKALETLEDITTSTTKTREHADWYSILCLLKLERNTEATNLLFEISNSNHLYNKRAADIISSYKLRS